MPKPDVIVGAGIVGLAHAYALAKRGRKVLVLERSGRAEGASVRNFGMVWPIGQPVAMREIAVRSRELWLEILQAAGIWHRQTGSLHLSYRDDETQVLQEFVAKGPALGYDVSFISPDEVARLSPVVRPEGLQGGMWSELEVCVNPRTTLAKVPEFLAKELGVEFRFGQAVTSAEAGRVVVDGRTIEAENIVLCTGSDFETLFPSQLSALGLVKTKLQMLKASFLEPGTDLGTHLCAGLTLPHYANFGICDSLAALKARIADEQPETVEWGVHILVSQHEDGLLSIGDSHEYGDFPFFNRESVDELILRHLNQFLPVETLEIQQRWHGVYAKHPTKPYIFTEPTPGVHAVIGVGGAGMTLSFGLAHHLVDQILS
ncbi:MAG: TIGR03364 family FAD-dependent oxidoreductase [Fimbriimonas sp.]